MSFEDSFTSTRSSDDDATEDESSELFENMIPATPKRRGERRSIVSTSVKPREQSREENTTNAKVPNSPRGENE